MIDNRNYTFVSMSYRRSSLTAEEAQRMKRAYDKEARKIGLKSEARIYYRDGTEIKASLS